MLAHPGNDGHHHHNGQPTARRVKRQSADVKDGMHNRAEGSGIESFYLAANFMGNEEAICLNYGANKGKTEVRENGLSQMLNIGNEMVAWCLQMYCSCFWTVGPSSFFIESSMSSGSHTFPIPSHRATTPINDLRIHQDGVTGSLQCKHRLLLAHTSKEDEL